MMDDATPRRLTKLTLDPHHELRLLRDLAIVNARTIDEFGPLPPGGLATAPKRKPDLPCQAAPIPCGIEEQEDTSMKLSSMAAVAALTAAASVAACGSEGGIASSESPNQTSQQSRVARTSSDIPAIIPEAATPATRQQERRTGVEPPVFTNGSDTQIRPEFSKKFERCMQGASSTGAQVGCIRDEIAYQDDLLNANYKKLADKIPENEQLLREDDHGEWLAETNRACRLTGDDPDQDQVYESEYCRLFRTALRSYELSVEIELQDKEQSNAN